jgi:hypothetical protein
MHSQFSSTNRRWCRRSQVLQRDVESVMKASISFALLVTLSGSVLAQPAPPVTEPSSQPVSSPAPAAPVQLRLQLSEDEQELLASGEISTGAHIGGGVAALFLGFGIGHAVQGRWGDRGWIFTLGETASIGVMIYGVTRAASCVSDELGGGCGSSGLGLIAGGAIALTGFHLWETIDAFVAPAGHNRRVRALQARTGLRSAASSILPYVAPPRNGDGAVGGLTLRF